MSAVGQESVWVDRNINGKEWIFEVKDSTQSFSAWERPRGH